MGLGFAVTQIAHNWSKAQSDSIYAQLKNGVRYLDLRVIYRDSKKAFYTVHGLYGPSLDDVLNQIKSFLKENPKEILVVQVGDLRYMGQNSDAHIFLAKRLYHTLGDLLISRSEYGLNSKIGDIWKGAGRIFLIFNHNETVTKFDRFFSASTIDSYWANADTPSILKERLDQNLQKRKVIRLDQLFVIQSQMTSSDKIIKAALNPFSKGYKSLKDMAKDVHQNFPKWLLEWKKYGLSIVMLDFINKSNSQQIVDLNLSFQLPVR